MSFGFKSHLNLPAKVLCPDAGSAISRPRLFRTLDQLIEKPIIWLHAAAGSGKTTLLTTYLRAREARALWYDVDAGDADVSSLFHYLRIAAEAALGAGIELPLPRPASPEAQRIFGRRFFEALFAQLPPGACLVFDNYQEAAHEPLWNEMFRELCAVVTPGVRVLVASRVGPPPSLARFFAQDDLRLLTNPELRLDEHEIQLLSSDRGETRRGPTLDSARLLALTAGWAVAVALLAKSQATRAHLAHESRLRWPEDDLQSIFDFLAGEVFEQLGGPSQELLLQIAVLPSFTAAMAAQLTGKHDAALLLSNLHRNHLLIERHGESGFRLHDLFRMFLLDRGALTQDEGTRKALAGRAALLLAKDDQFPAAADLLAEARSWGTLGDLIVQQAPLLASQNRIATLGSSLARMPPEHRDTRPWLGYWRAVSVLGRQGSEAHELAERAFQQFRAAGDVPGSVLSWALVVQAIVTAGENLVPLERWLPALDELALPATTPEIQAKVASSELLGHAFWDGSTPRAVEVADRAIAIVGRHGTRDDRVLSSGFATFVYIFAGHSERIRDVQRLALDQQSASSPDPLAKIINLHCEAVWALTQARLAAAAVASEQGLALAQASGIDAWNNHLRSAGAMSAIGSRDYTLAERILEPKDSLRAALRQARHVGIGVFLGSSVVARLVTAALEYEVELDYAHELLRGYGLEPGPDAYGLAAWPWPVKIRALGSLEIVVAGQPLRFGRKPPNVLLALLKLLVASGEPVTPERLSTALWPGYGAQPPRGSLDTALYRLRKLLGTEAAIRSENGHVILDPQLCWTDTRAFALTCARIAELASSEGRQPLEVTNIELHERKLLDLYRGPLGNDDDPPPLARAREQLRRRFLRATAELEHLWLRLGEAQRRDRLVELAAARDGGQGVPS